MAEAQKHIRHFTSMSVPLPRDAALGLLGVFHVISAALMAAIPIFYGYYIHSLTLDWGMLAILTNAIVAFGVTAPLSKRKPSTRWRSLWLLWLLVGYAVVGIIARSINFHTLQLGRTYWSYAITLCAGHAEVLLAVACSALLAFTSGSKHYTQVFGWKTWTMLSMLIAAAYWNKELLWIPSYLLIFLGSYVAYSSLGTVWLLRSVKVTVCMAAIPAAIVINAFIAASHGHGGNHLSLEWLWSAAPITPIPCNIQAWCSCFLLSFPVLTLSMVLVEKRYWIRSILLFALLTQIAGLIGTGRRAALTGLCLMAVISLSWVLRLKFRKLLLITGSAFLFVVVLDLARVLRIHEYFMIAGSSADHLANARAGLAGFLSHPLLGIGFGRHYDHGQIWAAANPGVGGTIYGHAHNDFIDLLEGSGIVGFSLAVAAAIQLAAAGGRCFTTTNSPAIRLLILGFGTQVAACIFTSALMYGQFLHPHWIIPSGAMIAGLFGAFWSERESYYPADTRSDLPSKERKLTTRK